MRFRFSIQLLFRNRNIVTVLWTGVPPKMLYQLLLFSANRWFVVDFHWWIFKTPSRNTQNSTISKHSIEFFGIQYFKRLINGFHTLEWMPCFFWCSFCPRKCPTTTLWSSSVHLTFCLVFHQSDDISLAGIFIHLSS